ncbi:MAG TPA: stage II sporulation protein M [Nocardioides sp.]|uniref:stage II sporulation protein M n=1 Tax=Nocardioides sp. TaxID=35761 RepID=UPI002E36EB09|nr:stage II sporulation protein M [Nocardioides sp.]HEX3930049.1 stage II sporulation protein M [Nocardioides sp.]
MDLDAFVLANHAEWQRLDALARQRRLDGRESDELVERYQRVATHLSMVRTTSPDATVVTYLSLLLSRARNRAGRARGSTWDGVRSFVVERFPAALYRLRWWWLGTLAGNVVATAVMMVWLLHHPDVEQTMLSPRQVDQLVNHDFSGYYSQYAASHFAAEVWTNNVWVSALCLSLGVLGVPVLYLLFQNIANLAVIGSIMTRHGHAAQFWGLILPHGMLELTAVFVAGGVGLRLFWAWVEPGDLTRAQSFAREGRTAATVAVGLAGVLAVSGCIEAFVTPSSLPTWGRIAIGVLAEATFLAYVFVLGRRAFLLGHTGDVDPLLLDDRAITQA